ncbi:MAG: hypothetical protein R3349_06435 [Geminicoccaceae bacterium]|nr:hypothetical protein [Geminicoccaceae bacterium]
MTEPGGAVRRPAIGAAILILGAGVAAAQDPGSTAERARQAFSPGQPAAAAAEVAEQAEAEAAAREAAERLGVDLLSTSVVEAAGRRLIAARVMEPGSDSNVAFLVQTLVIDPDTGEVLGVFPGTEDEVRAFEDLAVGAPAPAEEPETTGAE